MKKIIIEVNGSDEEIERLINLLNLVTKSLGLINEIYHAPECNIISFANAKDDSFHCANENYAKGISKCQWPCGYMICEKPNF